MNARTIQHPGIEIREIDLTEYKDTVTTNNAYVIGFTDRGPIYDYSWITTRSEFINLYGEPQTEAEKYLYYAVQSILNNGGTPIVARMPYDNKQCKAYKALKIKYASVAEDENSDTGFTLFDWENDTQYSPAASALISLDRVGKYINPEGYATALETLSNQTITIAANAAMGTGEPETVINAKDLTYNNLLLALNSDAAFDADLADDPWTIEYVKTVASINSMLNYINNTTDHDTTISAVVTNLSSYMATLVSGLTNLNDETSDWTDNISAYSSKLSELGWDTDHITKDSITGVLSNVYISGTIKNSSLLSAYITEFTPSGITSGGWYKSIDGIFNVLSGSYTTNNAEVSSAISFDSWPTSGTASLSIPQILTGIKNSLVNVNKLYVDIKEIGISNGSSIGEATLSSLLQPVVSLTNYINAGPNAHNLSLSGFAENSRIKGILTQIYANCSGVLGDIIPGILGYNDILSGYTNHPDKLVSGLASESVSGLVTDVVTCPSGISGAIAAKINMYPVLSYVYPEGSVADWLPVFKSFITLEAAEKEVETKGNYIKINGKRPTDLGIPSDIIKKYCYGGDYYASISDCLSGNLFSKADLEQKDKAIKEFDNALAQIFNDPFFKKLDGTLAGQAIVDAHLLTTPELSYEYGVYLDSVECDISNEQYDDLVTTNNFTKADSTVSKYGSDIDNANFIVVDKQKTIVDGIGSNQGYFVTLIDPYDALKMQRMLVNPCQEKIENNNATIAERARLEFYGEASDFAWKKLFKNEINTLNTLQRVKNADGMWIGEPNEGNKAQLLDSWSVPLTADYYNQSISKDLMGLFPQIPLTDVASNAGNDNALCTIDKQYSSYIVVAVCKTTVNPSDGKITVAILEQFFGSLFDEKDVQSGRDLYIGNIINSNSNYIEFYRNTYLKPAFGAGTEPPEFKKTPVPQFYIKDSVALNNAAKMVGVDIDNYAIKDGDDNDPEYVKYLNDLRSANIFIFDKKRTILYNNHPQAILTSFSKKEAQKVIANTTGLFGQEYGTTANIGNNFITDMDRCVSFIKNIDDIPIYFVADAGLSTIAQFCDNVVWDAEGNNGAGKWVTQNFDPDNDPDVEDRVIAQYTDVATWRKVIDKLDQISREIRKDCMTIIDAPRQLTLDGAAPKIRRSKPQNNWDDVVGDKLRFISGINSSYSAGYYNWLRTTDEFSGNALWLPPTCKIIGNYMYLNAINLPWLAPAGLTYGVITGIHGISHNPSPAEEDQIYMKSWNYIKQYPFDGFIIEGQKTTLTKNSAFNRVNVRTLFLDLERYVYNVARTFKYTVNNQYTREQFVQTIKPKFEDYMIRHGLYDYRIVCNDTNNTPESIDRNELRVAIYLKPAKLIEFILIDFIAAKTGANFDEIIL